jgi:hypothetical protein
MPAFFYINILPSKQATLSTATFDPFGDLLMRAIFTTAPPKVRQGFVRKRENDARPVAQSQPQTFQILRIEPPRAAKVVPSNSPKEATDERQENPIH